MTIGGRLREERNRLGLSQTDFAALAGTTKKSQIEYEKDSTYPNAAYLSFVAKSGADVQYIVTGIRSDTMLTPDERQLLALFRTATLTGKMAAVGALQGVQNAEKKQGIKIISSSVGGDVVNGDLTKKRRKKI